MNKIYKLVWNQVRGCYVVASEFAKAHGKSARRAVVGAFVAAAMVGSMGVANAGSITRNSDNVLMDGDTSLGVTVNDGVIRVSSINGAIIRGNRVQVDGFYSTAMGELTKALGTDSTAMGAETTASGGASTAMGAETIASGEDSIAGGFGSVAGGESSLAMGYYTLSGKQWLRNDKGEFINKEGHVLHEPALNQRIIDDSKKVAYTTALGFGTEASGEGSLATGGNTLASGEYSTAMGYNTTASGKYSTAMGYYTHATDEGATAMGWCTTAEGEHSTAMGNQTWAQGDYSTAMGSHTAATGEFSTAMGDQTTASGEASTAMGYNTTASGTWSTAMGVDSVANGDNSLAALGGTTGAVGEDGKPVSNKGNGAMAIGDGALAQEDNTFAIGAAAKATAADTLAFGNGADATAERAVAIGSGAKATAAGAVAIGQGSVADVANTVSVGAEGAERKIVNVAAGEIAENSHDAVNGGQLKAIDTRVTNNTNNISTNTQNIGINRTNINDNAKEIQSLWQQISDKKDVKFTWNPNQMIGNSYTDEDGKLVYQMGLQENQIGTVLNFVADVYDAEENQGKSVNVSNTGVVVSNEYKDKAVTIAADGIDMGGSKITNVAAGIVSNDSKDAVNGSQLFATNEAVAKNKSAIEANKEAIAANADNIKVNANNIEANKKAIKDEAKAREQGDADTLKKANNYTDDSIKALIGTNAKELEHKINETSARVDRVGATAAALAAINYQPMAKGQSQVAVGMGGYKGKKATALGLAYQISDRVSGSVAGSANGSERMFNVGFNYVFGQHSDKDVAQCAAVPGSMSLKEAEMQAKIDSQDAKINTLEADNAAMKARLDKSETDNQAMQVRMAQLEAMVKALTAK